MAPDRLSRSTARNSCAQLTEGVEAPRASSVCGLLRSRISSNHSCRSGACAESMSSTPLIAARFELSEESPDCVEFAAAQSQFWDLYPIRFLSEVGGYRDSPQNPSLTPPHGRPSLAVINDKSLA